MKKKTRAIEAICDLLMEGDKISAQRIIAGEYPFTSVPPEKRSYTPKESMTVFIRDGFIDRYSSQRLVFPGTLRLIHRLLPEDFPFHTNWKMSETHVAFWELLPTIDHVVPVARGGKDIFENWVSTSQIRNSAKSNWLLEEIGWSLMEPGSISDWDGLTRWFLKFTSEHPEHLSDSYIRTWQKAALTCMPASVG